MSAKKAGPWNYWVLLGSISLFVWIIANVQSFRSFVGLNAWTAYGMGYAKLFCLGTLGEIIKNRMKTGSWYLPKILQKALV